MVNTHNVDKCQVVQSKSIYFFSYGDKIMQSKQVNLFHHCQPYITISTPVHCNVVEITVLLDALVEH